ncbi:MAG: hypothetical protein GX804_11470 [Lentisphaerae bacterium]|jgi:copper chaperone CopZ|nr:hypothetical protein [Lentisphaerota bacterium]
MKREFFIIAVIAVFTLLNGCRVSDVKEATVIAPGVRNETCLEKVSEAIKTVHISTKSKPPEVVSADFETGEIVIRYDSMQLGTKNLEHAIAEAGFSCGPFPANKEAAAKLPSECRVEAD